MLGIPSRYFSKGADAVRHAMLLGIPSRCFSVGADVRSIGVGIEVLLCNFCVGLTQSVFSSTYTFFTFLHEQT